MLKKSEYERACYKVGGVWGMTRNNLPKLNIDCSELIY